MKKVLPALLLVFLAEHAECQTSAGIELIRIEGQTMGTTYAVVYFDERGRHFKLSIDSLLKEVNRAISNYDPQSDVSRFNRSVSRLPVQSDHFQSTLRKSLDISRASEGNFDPTVMPLVNLWGFGPDMTLTPSQVNIDSIKKFVGYEHLSVGHDGVRKDHPNVQVDFGGIGQGYGVDVISNFLKEKSIENFLVELGGEGFANGKNPNTGASWKIGIIDPRSSHDEQHLLGYAVVDDGAFTTSGNYFNYRIIDGKKYGHTISPFTGFPVQQDLISVTVFAKDCSTADAWATAFMVAGKHKAIDFLKRNNELSAILISLDGDKQIIFVSDNISNKVFLESSHDH